MHGPLLESENRLARYPELLRDRADDQGVGRRFRGHRGARLAGRFGPSGGPMATTTNVADAELIGGPSALSGGWSRFFHLTWTLAVHEFKLRFFGSVLGYFWQLMRPLLLFGVLYLIFAVILKVGSGVKYFPAVLLFNIVIYTFYAEATTMSVRSVVDR